MRISDAMVSRLQHNDNRGMNMKLLISFVQELFRRCRPPSEGDIEYVVRYHSGRFMLDCVEFITLTAPWRKRPWRGDRPQLSEQERGRMSSITTNILRNDKDSCMRFDVLYFNVRNVLRRFIPPPSWDEFCEFMEENANLYKGFDSGYVYLAEVHPYSAAEWAEWEERPPAASFAPRAELAEQSEKSRKYRCPRPLIATSSHTEC